MSSVAAHSLVGGILLLWLGLVIQALRRKVPAFRSDIQLMASGITIVVAVDAGNAPVGSGLPLVLIGLAVTVTGAVRGVRQMRRYTSAGISVQNDVS